jgi:tripartite-type tricarboxylate transporter receptor subunit TctC
VVNTPSAAGVMALVSVMKEKADGYTLAVIGSAQITAQYLQDVPYKVLRDFIPIIQFMGYYVGLVVRTDSPWKTFEEFINYVKANPGKIHYATHGAGTPQHVVMERLAFDLNLKWTHIPFKGGIEAVTALLGGHVEAVSQVTEWKPFVDAGKLILLVTYGKKRMPDYPDVPTLIDLGYNIERTGFNGIVGPIGVPPERVDILAKAFRKAMDESEFTQMIKKFGLPFEYKSPEEFSRYIKEFDEETEVVVQKAGFIKK